MTDRPVDLIDIETAGESMLRTISVRVRNGIVNIMLPRNWQIGFMAPYRI